MFWDKLIITFVQHWGSSFWDHFFIVMTCLGEPYLYLPLIVIIYWCVDRRLGKRLSFILFFSTFTNLALKNIIMRPRPIGSSGIRSIYTKSADGWSFPSGHTQQSTAFWWGLASCWTKPLIIGLGISLVTMIGLSRIYLGVHWPSDVLGGFIIGALVVNIYLTIEKKLPAYWIDGAALLCTALLSFYSLRLPHFCDPLGAGIFTGFLAGATLEVRDGRAETKSSFNRWMQLLIGFSGLIILWLGLKALLPVGIYFAYGRALVVGLWIGAGAPWVFRRSAAPGKSRWKSSVNH
ncbi:MAG TPA: hypothetical protein DDW65_13340 [Firmicutes bacterium]|jgi:membrane-associated phospholipid phosphatase|nr:hypothetical protein [Bacillota bacterium]